MDKKILLMNNTWKYQEILEKALILCADVLYTDTEHPWALEVIKIFENCGFSHELFYVEDQNVRIHCKFTLQSSRREI